MHVYYLHYVCDEDMVSVHLHCCMRANRRLVEVIYERKRIFQRPVVAADHQRQSEGQTKLARFVLRGPYDKLGGDDVEVTVLCVVVKVIIVIMSVCVCQCMCVRERGKGGDT